jgi:hypothetical protein
VERVAFRRQALYIEGRRAIGGSMWWSRADLGLVYVGDTVRYPLVGTQEADYLFFCQSVSSDGNSYTASEIALVAAHSR